MLVGCLRDIWGMFEDCFWDVCGMFEGCLCDVCGMSEGCFWDVCGMFEGCLRMWVLAHAARRPGLRVPRYHIICVDHNMYKRQIPCGKSTPTL